MEPFVAVASIWKPWIIYHKDFQFRRSKNPGSASDITIQVYAKLLRDICIPFLLA